MIELCKCSGVGGNYLCCNYGALDMAAGRRLALLALEACVGGVGLVLSICLAFAAVCAWPFVAAWRFAAGTWTRGRRSSASPC